MPYTPDNPYLPGDPYSYDLKWIVTQIQTCLDNYESLTTNFGTLQTNFDTLYDYVHDYFDNLDINQEVQNKIEEMYNNGFFDNIINDWITDHNVLLVDTDQSGIFTAAEKAQARANIAAAGDAQLLWTNASPSSSFAAQTLNIDLSPYRFVLIEYRMRADQANTVFYISRVGGSPIVLGNFGGEIMGRAGTVTTSSAIFVAGYTITGFGTKTNDDTRMVPERIYGVM